MPTFRDPVKGDVRVVPAELAARYEERGFERVDEPAAPPPVKKTTAGKKTAAKTSTAKKTADTK